MGEPDEVGGGVRDLTEDVLVELGERSFLDTFHRLLGSVPGGEVELDDDVLLASCGQPVSAFNIAFIRRAVEDPDALVERSLGWFEERGLPGHLRVRTGLDPLLDVAAASNRLRVDVRLPVMMMVPPRRGRPRPVRLEVRRVCGAGDLEDHVAVASAGFGLPAAVAHHLFDIAFMRDPAFEAFTGYVDDVPVATSVLSLSEGVAGIYNVATVPAHRRCGYGEALTQHAVDRAADVGASVVTLQASPMGLPVYERMGFRTVSTHTILVRSR